MAKDVGSNHRPITELHLSRPPFSIALRAVRRAGVGGRSILAYLRCEQKLRCAAFSMRCGQAMEWIQGSKEEPQR